MVTINIKGHEIHPIHVKDSYNRRSVQIANNIIKILGTIGVNEDSVKVPLEAMAMKKAPASVSWYFDGRHLFYSYGKGSKFVENLAIVNKVLELEIAALLEKKKTTEEFVNEFREEHDVTEQRKNARATLGLEHDVIDMEVINKAYKDLAKEHHPDKETGDVAKFKEINHAHKILKRELQ